MYMHVHTYAGTGFSWFFRSKMAKAEAEKLVKVQKELNHLDNLVTADVSIIRDRIEMASIDFLQAQYVNVLVCLEEGIFF